MKIKRLIIFLTLGLLFGCTTQSSDFGSNNIHVCSDGSTVYDANLCNNYTSDQLRQNNQGQIQSSSQDNAEGNILKTQKNTIKETLVNNPEEIFPNINKIPTEYIISTISELNETSMKNYVGFIIAKQIKYSKTNSFGGDVVILRSYKFDEEDHAISAYYGSVNNTKAKRGYTQIDIPESEDTCFAYYKEYFLNNGANLMCHNKNFIIELAVGSTNFESVEILLQFKDLINLDK